MSRFLPGLLALATFVSVTPAIAQDAGATAAIVAPKKGQVLRDANGRRLGQIEAVQGDAVTVIIGMQMYRIPTKTLSLNEKGLQTSLKRAELR
jgi:hypothetical protein